MPLDPAQAVSAYVAVRAGSGGAVGETATAAGATIGLALGGRRVGDEAAAANADASLAAVLAAGVDAHALNRLTKALVLENSSADVLLLAGTSPLDRMGVVGVEAAA